MRLFASLLSAVGNIGGNTGGLCSYSELLIDELCPIS